MEKVIENHVSLSHKNIVVLKKPIEADIFTELLDRIYQLIKTNEAFGLLEEV
jgi:hypothetical protein